MVITRSEFLKGASAALMTSGCLIPDDKTHPRYALQLFSIHKIFWSSPEKTLAALKRGGYDGVEFYDTGARRANELRQMCLNAGLSAMGIHLNGDIALVGDELKKTLDFAAEAGFESVVTPHALRNSADEYKAFGFMMGKAAEAAQRYGIKIGIHSTYHHFTTKYDGKTAWDMIYSETSPLLQQQIDTGNTFHTGSDLIGILKKYRGRHYSIHAKENVPTQSGIFGVRPTDGGKCVPWREVIQCMLNDLSQRWWIVEAEGRPDSIEPALACLKLLKTWNA